MKMRTWSPLIYYGFNPFHFLGTSTINIFNLFNSSLLSNKWIHRDVSCDFRRRGHKFDSDTTYIFWGLYVKSIFKFNPVSLKQNICFAYLLLIYRFSSKQNDSWNKPKAFYSKCTVENFRNALVIRRKSRSGEMVGYPYLQAIDSRWEEVALKNYGTLNSIWVCDMHD